SSWNLETMLAKMKVRTRSLSMRLVLLALLLLIVGGCASHSVSTYRGTNARDGFTELVDGRLIRCARWQISVDNRRIDIPHEESTIKVTRSGGYLNIAVNGQ